MTFHEEPETTPLPDALEVISGHLAARLANHFVLPSPIEVHDFPDKGNINQNTFLVLAGPPDNRGEYLLQQINSRVFAQPRLVMHAVQACINAQNASLKKGILQEGEEWETIALIPTRQGDAWLEVANEAGRGCWRLMTKIGGARTFKSLSEIHNPRERLRVAEEAARGLALFGNLTSEMEIAGLVNPLPGYRDTRLYYRQLSSVLEENRTIEQAAHFLPEDPMVSEGTARHFLVHISHNEYRRRMDDPDIRRVLALAKAQEDFALLLFREMRSGGIRTVAIHGDTKLDNLLFSTRTGRVKAMIDLDTVMPHTWLSDWGDMVRSLVNTAGEKQLDLSRIQVDMEVFRAAVRGFLRAARAITEHETALMVDSVQVMTLELGARFLADYLRGDSYFAPGPGDHPEINKARALVQFTLFERLREQADKARKAIEEISKEWGHCD